MRFMIIVKGNKDTEAGAMPPDEMLAEMADYHEELAKAGALLDASGLKPTSTGWRIKYSRGKRIVTDGPFAEAKGHRRIHPDSGQLARGGARMDQTLSQPVRGSRRRD